ncbi:MAG: translation initiation factor IF-1 [Verrucomicrobiales bacterium]|jgi:translation initiation factor IF-1
MSANDPKEFAHFGSEPPVVALAIMVKAFSETVYQLRLPNGKLAHGHVPRRLAASLLPLQPGDALRVEMTPYDFERARITAKVDTSSEAFSSQ